MLALCISAILDRDLTPCRDRIGHGVNGTGFWWKDRAREVRARFKAVLSHYRVWILEGVAPR